MKPGRVVGFGGAAESGKSTSADMLVSIAEPHQHEHVEFSDPIFMTASEWLNKIRENSSTDDETQIRVLAEILSESLGVSLLDLSKTITRLNEEYLENVAEGALETLFTPENKGSHRPLLEWLGHTAIQLVSPQVWGNIVHQKVLKAMENGADLVTVGGVRSKSDYGVVRNSGGTVIRLHRSRDSDLLLTEHQLAAWRADFELVNNGSLEELREKLVKIWTEIAVEQTADKNIDAA